MQSREIQAIFEQAQQSPQSTQWIEALAHIPSTEDLWEALQIQKNDTQISYIVFNNQPLEGVALFCLTVLNRLSPEQCFTLLQTQNNDHWNSIHIAAHNQSAEAFRTFCETTLSKLSPEQCFTLLQAQNNIDHWNSLHIATRYQSAEAFRIFCETTLSRLSPEQCFTLLQAQAKDHWNSIHLAA